MRVHQIRALVLSVNLCICPWLAADSAKAGSKEEHKSPVAEQEAAEEEISVDDKTVIPGERVGPILKGTTLFGLKTLFGGGQVKAADIDVGEGNTEPGTRLFEGTDQELEILFNPEGDEREIFDIRIIGTAWKFKNGLRLGLSMQEVEKINGKPFSIWGFGWDYGGFANFEEGPLAGKVTLRFGVKGDIPDSISGDQMISTTNKKLRAAKPFVEQIGIVFR